VRKPIRSLARKDIDGEFPKLGDDRHDAVVFRPRQGDHHIVDRSGPRLLDEGVKIAAEPTLLREPGVQPRHHSIRAIEKHPIDGNGMIAVLLEPLHEPDGLLAIADDRQIAPQQLLVDELGKGK
jgi:hypothetical protein